MSRVTSGGITPSMYSLPALVPTQPELVSCGQTQHCHGYIHTKLSNLLTDHMLGRCEPGHALFMPPLQARLIFSLCFPQHRPAHSMVMQTRLLHRSCMLGLSVCRQPKHMATKPCRRHVAHHADLCPSLLDLAPAPTLDHAVQALLAPLDDLVGWPQACYAPGFASFGSHRTPLALDLQRGGLGEG